MRGTQTMGGLLCGYLCLTSAARAQGNVLVVDDDGGPGVYLEIKDAVDAAQNGDLILVKDGTYSGWLGIFNQSLSIHADAGATVDGTAAFQISGIGGRLVLRGLQLSTQNFDIFNSPGDVWIEDCQFRDLFAIEGLKLSQSDVTFVRTSVTGMNQQPLGPSTLNSLAVLVDFRSEAFFYDCVLTGGAGGDESIGVPAMDGASGLWLKGFSSAFASGCTITGGDSLHEEGGPGLTITGSCTLVELDSNFQGGQGNPTGPAITGNGPVTSLPTPSRSFVGSSPVRYGATGDVQVDGVPGDLVWVLHGLGLDATYQGNYQGAWLIDPTQLLTLRVGVLPGTGSLSLNYPVPDFTGLPFVEFFAQPLHFPLDGSGPVLGAGSAILMLDPVY